MRCKHTQHTRWHWTKGSTHKHYSTATKANRLSKQTYAIYVGHGNLIFSVKHLHSPS